MDGDGFDEIRRRLLQWSRENKPKPGLVPDTES